jgi:hypothetical protein
MIKYQVFYKLDNNDGKMLRVYRLDNKILIALNEGTDKAIDFMIPKDQIATIGRALITAWEEVSHDQF